MKEKVKAAYMEELEMKLGKARESYEVARRDTIEAEGRMVTRYDSTKTETAWLADGYLETVNTLEKTLENFKEQKPYVNIGDVVSVDVFKNDNYEGSSKIVMSKQEADWESVNCLFLGKTNGDIVPVKQKDTNYGYQIRDYETMNAGEKKVKIGDLVTVETEDGYEEFYYLVPETGGMEIRVNKKYVFCISCMAPLTQKVLELTEGSEFDINGECMKIISID